MIKKIIKPDNYNVAYFPTAIAHTLTITKSLESDYSQERDEELELSDYLTHTNKGTANDF